MEVEVEEEDEEEREQVQEQEHMQDDGMGFFWTLGKEKWMRTVMECVVVHCERLMRR